MKIKIAVFLAAAGLLLAALVLFRFLPQAKETPGAENPAATRADAPSMPIDAALLQSGEGVSTASIARMQARAAELREARAQLEVKRGAINQRLSDPAEAANAAALQEALKTLQTSTEQMLMEESALAEFLENERKPAPSGR
jgi:hypothetical protein